MTRKSLGSSLPRPSPAAAPRARGSRSASARGKPAARAIAGLPYDPDVVRAIERVAQEWRASVDATPDVIIMHAADFTIRRANRAATTFFDREFPDLLGRRVLDLLGEFPRGADPFQYARLRATRQRVVGEVYLRRRRTWVSSALDPILDRQGKLTGAVQVLRDISDRRRTDRQLRRSLAELQRLSAHLERAREEERTAIAREIHDEFGHALTAIKMEAAWLGGKAGPGQEWLRAGMGAVADRVDVAIATVRRLATQLRPGVLDDLGIVAALEWQGEEFERTSAVETRVSVPSGRLAVDREAATVLFRVCQEALTNVARHARASLVAISLQRRGRRLLLRVADDGQGFRSGDAGAGKSLGLLGMHERVHNAGGRLSVKSAPGKGTVVTVSIPAQRRPA